MDLQKQGYSNLCRRRPDVAQIEFVQLSIRAGFGTLRTLYKLILAQTEILKASIWAGKLWIFNTLLQKLGYSNLCRPNVAQIKFLSFPSGLALEL